MKLNLHIISEDIQNLIIDKSIRQDEMLLYYGVKLLSCESNKPKTDILYISTKEELERYPNKQQLNGVVLTGSSGTNADIPCDYIDLGETVGNAESLNMMQDVFLRYNKWEQKVFECVRDKDGWNRCLEIGMEEIGNPMAIFDANMMCIAMAGEESIMEDDEIWNEIFQLGRLTPEKLLERTGADDSSLLWNLYNRRTAFIFKMPNFSKKCIQANIFADQKRYGCIGLTETLRTFSQRTTSLLNHFCQLIIPLYEQRNIYGHSDTGFDQICQQILDDETPDYKHISQVLKNYGWHINDKYRVFFIRENPYSDTSDYDNNQFYFSNIGPAIKTLRYNAYLFLMQNITQYGATENPVALLRLLNQLDLTSGASNVFNDFCEIPFYCRQAQWASQGVAFKNECDEAERICYYDNCTTDYIINNLTEKNDKRMLCVPEIILLDSIDRSEKSDYVATLYTYLSNGRHLIKTANKLFIHRNTLVYRLSKIKEIVGDKVLDDYDNTLDLLLSCRIILYYRMENDR